MVKLVCRSENGLVINAIHDFITEFRDAYELFHREQLFPNLPLVRFKLALRFATNQVRRPRRERN